MTHPTQKTVDEVISRLISVEEAEAMARFRAGDFEARIQNKIRAMKRVDRRLSAFRPVRRPVWAAVTIVALAGGMFLLVLSRHASGPDMASEIESLLSQTRVRDILNAPAITSLSSNIEAASVIERMIIATIQSGRWRSSSAHTSPLHDSAAHRKTPPARPLSLEETYRILFIERPIERSLALVS